MNKLKYVIPMLLIGVFAWGVTKQLQYDKVNSPRPQLFPSGIFIGSDLKNPVSDVRNKMAKHLCGHLDYDFPALGAGSQALATPCQDSAAITVTGCGFSDRLEVAVDQAKVSSNITFIPYVSAANTLKITACSVGLTDAGTANQPDSGFDVCCDGY